MTPRYTFSENTLENTIPINFEDARQLGEEYGELMIKTTLTTQEDDRIDEILHLATLNDSVDFWVSHAACEYGAKIGLLSPEALKSYEDQRAILRERIDTYQFTNPDEEAILYNLLDKARAQYDAAQKETTGDSSITHGLSGPARQKPFRTHGKKGKGKKASTKRSTKKR